MWTNQPAALTELIAATDRRVQADLTGATQARITCEQTAAAASASAELRLQYSTDGGTNWSYADGASGPAVALGTAAGRRTGAWANLVAGAKADVLLRIVGINGNATADPAFRNLTVEAK